MGISFLFNIILVILLVFVISVFMLYIFTPQKETIYEKTIVEKVCPAIATTTPSAPREDCEEQVYYDTVYLDNPQCNKDLQTCKKDTENLYKELQGCKSALENLIVNCKK